MHSTFFPARMSLAVQCAAGTMRVYAYKKAHGCKPITKCFRARIRSKGKRIWGSPCSNVADAVESLRQIANHREDNGMVLTGVTESVPAAGKRDKSVRCYYTKRHKLRAWDRMLKLRSICRQGRQF